MKYLKRYKVYESLINNLSIKHEIEDILSEISDKGYRVKVSSHLTEPLIEIIIDKGGHRLRKKELQEISESIERMYDYMRKQTQFSIPNSVYVRNSSGSNTLMSWPSLDSRYSDFEWGEWAHLPFNTIIIRYKN